MTSLEWERNFSTESSHRQIVAYLQSYMLRITTENVSILYLTQSQEANLNFQVNYFHPIIKYIDVHSSTIHKFHSNQHSCKLDFSVYLIETTLGP